MQTIKTFIPHTTKRKMKKVMQYGVLFVQQITRTAPPKSRALIQSAHLEGGRIFLSGHIFSNYKPHLSFLTIRKFRDERTSLDFPLEITGPAPISLPKKVLQLFGFRWDQFSTTIDFPWTNMPSSIYGIGFKTDQVASSPVLSPKATQILTDDAAQRTFCLFTEPSVNVARIEMYHFGSDVLSDLKARTTLDRPDTVRCIIGEYTNTARDNGKALFEWLHNEAHDVRASYVVEDVNFDAYATDQPGVFIFGSPDHLKQCLDADVCAFTHHRSYVYPYILNLIAPERYQATRTLFLQHGIIAMKKSIARHYDFDQVGYDAFCVSSENEKSIITNHFGYPPSHVVVTGLARFDQLLQKAKTATPKSNQILIFPTWRLGLEKQDTKDVAATSFIQNWQDALKKLQSAGVQTCLILHPMLSRHAALFAPYVNEIRETKVFQETLVQSQALITDYSSVSFDALLLQKPVFLYHFDQEESGLAHDAFIDIKTQLPGQMSKTSAALLEHVMTSQANQWAFTHTTQRALYFDAFDDQNTARLRDVIKRLGSSA